MASPGQEQAEHTMPDEIDDVIRENAEGPASAEVDGQDQIEADKYLAAKDAAKSNRLGIRLVKIVPPGAV